MHEVTFQSLHGRERANCFQSPSSSQSCLAVTYGKERSLGTVQADKLPISTQVTVVLSNNKCRVIN